MTTLTKDIPGIVWGTHISQVRRITGILLETRVRGNVLKNPFPGRCNIYPPTKGPNEKLKYVSPKVTLEK